MNIENQKKYPTCLQNFRSYISEWCTNTSVHGFKFLGERRRSIFERLWWLIIQVVCLFFCVTYILSAYYKWQTSPVVVSFATKDTPVWEIPFPAVTICPEVKTRKADVNFTELVLLKKRQEKLTTEQSRHLSYLSLICTNNWRDHAEKEEEFLTEDFYDFLLKMQPKIDDTIDECVWFSKNCTADISQLFTPLVTSDGICFSFNLLDRTDIFTDDAAQNYYMHFNVPHQSLTNWTLDKGYGDETRDNLMPRRSYIPGIAGGLQLTFWIDSQNLDYICGDALQGYKIILHSPMEIPFTQQKYFRIGLNQILVAAVTPTIIKTSHQLRNYHPNNRNCYFSEEKQLRFFKAYAQGNCIHECLANFTLQNCGCVSFQMPRLNSTPICGYGKHSCVAKTAGLFVSSNFDEDAVPDFMDKCDCRQTCSSINFDTEISQIEWKWQSRTRILSTLKHELRGINHYSKLQIFFKDMQFITSERNELYGLMDFLSSCGGLLGLFIGFSFISLVEIIYFCSLRLLCNYRTYGPHYWSGDPDLVLIKVE